MTDTEITEVLARVRTIETIVHTLYGDYEVGDRALDWLMEGRFSGMTDDEIAVRLAMDAEFA